MNIDFDRRHAFYLDTDDNIRPLSPHRLDRLWSGEPGAAMPELAGHRVRFALLHIERFSKPPAVVVEHYPVLTFDPTGNLDLEHHHAQLQAEVDHLESTGYAPVLSPGETESTWHPDPTTRRRLIAATQPSYARRSPRGRPRHERHVHDPALRRRSGPNRPTVAVGVPTRLTSPTRAVRRSGSTAP